MNYFKIMGFLLATMEIVLAYNQHEVTILNIQFMRKYI